MHASPREIAGGGAVAARVAALDSALVLADPGPRDAEVAATLAELLGIGPEEACRLVADAPSRLAAGLARPVRGRIAARLEALGAAVSQGGYRRLRRAAEAARADLCLADPGPDPEATLMVLIAATGRDPAAMRVLVIAAGPWAPVPVAAALLPVRARWLAARLAGLGAATVTVPAREHPATPALRR